MYNAHKTPLGMKVEDVGSSPDDLILFFRLFEVAMDAVSTLEYGRTGCTGWKQQYMVSHMHSM